MEESLEAAKKDYSKGTSKTIFDISGLAKFCSCKECEESQSQSGSDGTSPQDPKLLEMLEDCVWILPSTNSSMMMWPPQELPSSDPDEVKQCQHCHDLAYGSRS